MQIGSRYGGALPTLLSVEEVSMKKIILFIFAALGLVLTLLIIIGAAIDIATFDRTRGGYEPPYTGYTGQRLG